MKNIVIAIALCVTACGGAADPFDESQDDATAASYTLFTVRRDERKCAAPRCGGWWASKLHSTTPTYVSELDFSRAQLDERTEGQVRSAPGEELLFKARLGAADKLGLRQLLVKDAWRGLPGIVPAATDVVYSVAARTPARSCVAAPCNNQIATTFSTGNKTELTRVGLVRAAHAFVDQEWLQDRILLHGALVTAKFTAGEKMAAGTEVVLDASQVWIHLPEIAGPCSKPVQAACGSSQVQAYDRTADRCVTALGCVDRGICSMMMPSCGEGYVASSWTAAPNGCLVTACDPAWVVE